MSNTEKTREIVAANAGMDSKTARRYLALNRLRSESGIGAPGASGGPFSEV